MIHVSSNTRVLLAISPCDFRKGIDGLGAVCRQVLQQDPMSGTVFLFRNRRGTALKLLCYDGQGFWLAQKRLSEGKLKWWPKHTQDTLTSLAARELQVVLWNGNPHQAGMAEDWRNIS